MLEWAVSSLVTLAGWGLAFWFVPFSWVMCSRSSGAAVEGMQKSAS